MIISFLIISFWVTKGKRKMIDKDLEQLREKLFSLRGALLEVADDIEKICKKINEKKCI